MSHGQTQYLANRKAAFVADTVFSAGATIEIVNSSNSVLASATDGVATDTANRVDIVSSGGATVTAAGTAAGFNIRENTGDNICFAFRNITLTIPNADIDVATNTFTLTGHGLPNDFPLTINADVPTSSVSDGDTVYVTNATANTFQIARKSGGAVVNITSKSGVTNTIFNVLAVGAEGSNAVMQITGGTALSQDDTVTFNTLRSFEDVFSRKATAT